MMRSRAKVKPGKSWRNETSTFWGLFRMALINRNETGNQLRIYVSFHVKRTRRALGMFLFPFLKRNNGVRNALSSFHSISPPNAGKYPHFRPRLHRAVFYFANYAVSRWVFREFRLFCTASEVFMIVYTNKQPPQENYVCEMRICDLRTKLKKRDSVPQCFVSRNMKRPGNCAGLFRETKRRQKSCFVSVVSLPTCFNSGPSYYYCIQKAS